MGALEPLKPIVEKTVAAHMTAIVIPRSRLGVSHLRPLFWSHERNPVAAEAAVRTQPAHIPAG